MSTSDPFAPKSAELNRRALGLLGARLGAILAITVVMGGASRSWSDTVLFSPSTMWVTLGLLPVNVLCLWLVRRLYQRRGITLREALGIRRGKVWRDILWRILWLAVLNVPFAVVPFMLINAPTAGTRVSGLRAGRN